MAIKKKRKKNQQKQFGKDIIIFVWLDIANSHFSVMPHWLHLVICFSHFFPLLLELQEIVSVDFFYVFFFYFLQKKGTGHTRKGTKSL
jgi:hypothetical protein